jgi:hypothetical protein
MKDTEIRAALERHWASSESGDQQGEYEIYHANAVLEYPQSGERFCGVEKIQNSRTENPSNRHFFVNQVRGEGDLWITEYIITYDGKPVYTVSIMEFQDGRVQRETQYYADPFDAPAWRKKWTQ